MCTGSSEDGCLYSGKSESMIADQSTRLGAVLVQPGGRRIPTEPPFYSSFGSPVKLGSDAKK